MFDVGSATVGRIAWESGATARVLQDRLRERGRVMLLPWYVRTTRGSHANLAARPPRDRRLRPDLSRPAARPPGGAGSLPGTGSTRRRRSLGGERSRGSAGTERRAGANGSAKRSVRGAEAGGAIGAGRSVRDAAAAGPRRPRAAPTPRARPRTRARAAAETVGALARGA